MTTQRELQLRMSSLSRERHSVIIDFHLQNFLVRPGFEPLMLYFIGLDSTKLLMASGELRGYYSSRSSLPGGSTTLGACSTGEDLDLRTDHSLID